MASPSTFYSQAERQYQFSSVIVDECGDGDEEAAEEKVYREGMPVFPRADGRPPEPPEGFTIYTTESGAMVLRRKRVRNLQRLG